MQENAAKIEDKFLQRLSSEGFNGGGGIEV